MNKGFISIYILLIITICSFIVIVNQQFLTASLKLSKIQKDQEKQVVILAKQLKDELLVAEEINLYKNFYCKHLRDRQICYLKDVVDSLHPEASVVTFGLYDD